MDYIHLFLGLNNQKILVLKCDSIPFRCANYINQARVHQGYHYPRSISTTMKSAGYFEWFNKDYNFCINREFDKAYATSSQYFWSNGEQFKSFVKLPIFRVKNFIQNDSLKKVCVTELFLTREYTYDVMILEELFT